MLSTTVGSVAATIPAGADAIAESWPDVQVRRRCHTSVSPVSVGAGDLVGGEAF
jgi:hypothetical protein